MSASKIRLLLPLIVLAVTATATHAARVAPSDPDRGAGSMASTARMARPAGAQSSTDIKNLNTGLTYATIQDALNDPLTLAGHVLEVQVSPHAEGICTVSKAVTIQGGGGGAVITSTTDTGTSGDARGWFLITAAGVTFKDLTFDGSANLIAQGLRFKEAGAVQNCTFQHIKRTPPEYVGLAVVGFKNLTVTNCVFSDIGRIGVILFGADVTAATVSNCTYTGKGAGDWLDYGIELGGGAVATLTNNTITGCTGVALVDGSTSAGILITTYYGAGTTGTLTGNVLTGNSEAVAAGYDAADASTVVASSNDLSGNASDAIGNTSSTTTVDASGNWWGTNTPAGVAAEVVGTVDYTPWLHNGTDTSGSPGFQGDFSVLDVDDDSPQTGSLGRIAEAIGLVTGSTVNVAAGTYAEKVFVGKSVTLRGAQAGIDARGRSGSPESVISPNEAYCVVVQADNVTIDGFEITSDWATNSDVAGIYVSDNIGQPGEGGTELSGIVIKNTIIHDLTDGLRTGGQGIQGIVVGPKTDGVELAYNEIRNLHMIDDNYSYAPVGIMIWGNPGGQEAKNTNIHHNLVHTIENDDISVNPRGIQASMEAFHATISNNEIYGVVRGRGIRLYPEAHGTLNVTDNSVHDCGQVGIRVEAPATLTGNTITACPVGVWVKPSTSPYYTDLSVNVNQNNIAGNTTYGIQAIPGATQNVSVDATCNWWGHVNGPNVPPGNPSPGDGITGSATYAPWLSAAAPGGVCNQYGPNNVAASTTGLCLSNPTPCVTVPVLFNRADTTPARAISVTFQLSSNLELCGTPAASILQGSWLTGYTTNFQVVDKGSGVYTVDQAILGTTCGVTTGGQLFTVQVQKATGAPDGTGTITVTALKVRDCDNATLAGIPGAPASLPIDFTAPAVIANLAAAQVKSGNDADGTTRINLTFTLPGDAAFVKLYRAGYGGYPEYDDAPATGVPATPGVYPPGVPWSLAATLAAPVTSYADEVAWPNRDFWYYVAYVQDGCGNWSAVSNKTPGTLNYHLGDVAAGCVGENQVTTLDISFLGANYGVTLGYPDARACLDVGPTTNWSVNARPTTDNLVDFEDLMMFAINFGAVTAPQDGYLPVAAAADELWLEGPAKVVAGETFAVSLRMKGAGDLQGVSARLGWDAAVAEPVAVEAGELLSAQNGVAFSARAGNVDAAVLGTGRGIAGEGVLATVTFRARAAGEPKVALASVDARDAANRRVDLALGKPALPTATSFAPAMPNPFDRGTTLSFSLARAGAVELAIYSVDGRRVKTLLAGSKDPGAYRVTWNGTDERGQLLKPGLFYARLVTDQGRFTRTLVLAK